MTRYVVLLIVFFVSKQSLFPLFFLFFRFCHLILQLNLNFSSSQNLEPPFIYKYFNLIGLGSQNQCFSVVSGVLYLQHPFSHILCPRHLQKIGMGQASSLPGWFWHLSTPSPLSTGRQWTRERIVCSSFCSFGKERTSRQSCRLLCKPWLWQYSHRFWKTWKTNNLTCRYVFIYKVLVNMIFQNNIHTSISNSPLHFYFHHVEANCSRHELDWSTEDPNDTQKCHDNEPEPQNEVNLVYDYVQGENAQGFMCWKSKKNVKKSYFKM